jgi:hypothetical protein
MQKNRVKKSPRVYEEQRRTIGHSFLAWSRDRDEQEILPPFMGSNMAHRIPYANSL